MTRPRKAVSPVLQQLAALRQPAALPTYRSIKVPSWVLANVKQAELALHRKGQLSLSQTVLSPETCPSCQGRMQALAVKYEFRRCDSCGYVQQDLTTASNFWGGLVIGAGLALLFKALSAETPRPRRQRRRTANGR